MIVRQGSAQVKQFEATYLGPENYVVSEPLTVEDVTAFEPGHCTLYMPDLLCRGRSNGSN